MAASASSFCGARVTPRRASTLGRAARVSSSSSSSRAGAGAGARSLRLRVAAHDDTVFDYARLEYATLRGIQLIDVTADVRARVKAAGIENGVVNVLSRHTTTAVTINEAEGRLMDDVRQYLTRLAPPGDPYLHNDLHLRSGPPDWPGGDAAWRAQEPENAHSHLLSMLIGNSETIPVVDGELALGTWQSVMLVELDGPRTRTLGVQVVGVGVEKRADAGEPLGAYKSEAKGAAVVAESSGVDSAAAAYDDAFDAFCEEDPSADECKVFD